MKSTSRKEARAVAQRRYYEKNKAQLQARAKARYHERKKTGAVNPEPAQIEPILGSPESLPESTKPKSLFSRWIQRLTSKTR